MQQGTRPQDTIPQYIVVEGPIGVGKTTLVDGLTERLDGRIMLEEFEENPFLSLFYQERDRFAFQTELFFLLSRFRQQEAFLQAELFRRHTVSDYFFFKCRLFATLTLSEHELLLFDQLYKILCRSLPQPDLVLYLHAPLSVLLERIAERGRSYEQDMDPEYLGQLCELYNQEFFRQQQQFPVISVDTTCVDFRIPQNVDALVELIRQGARGRIEASAFPVNTLEASEE